MKLLRYLIISLVLFSTLSYAKVVEGTFKLNQFRDKSGNSFDVEIIVKYKIESLMGEPVVKATAKYEIGQFIDINGKSYTKDKLTKEQLSKLKIYDLYISVPFDTTYTGQGTNTLYIDMSMGAMGKVGEWSFNPPESPDWGKWIYVNQYQYLTKEEAKKAYLGLKRLGYSKNAYDSLAMVKKIKYSVSNVKMKQPLKDVWIDKDTNLMWQDEAYNQKEEKIFRKGKGNYNKVGHSEYAMKYCSNLVLNNFSDWRLPTFYELKILRSKKDNINYVGHTYISFKNGKASGVSFKSNKVYPSSKYDNSYNGYIRCVREIK